MSPAVFSQIVTILGVLGCIAGSVQEMYGAQSHWGMIAGVIVTVVGKVGAILSATQDHKETMQEAEHAHEIALNGLPSLPTAAERVALAEKSADPVPATPAKS